ncbi:MAG: ribonuclease R [Gammaproteobacteria bacterium]|nr:ribonuclease R [Gammaproteobacteria bacterium]
MSNKSPEKDKFAEREAQKYANPITSREGILALLEECDRPQNIRAISEALGLVEDQDLEALRRRLRAMERDGQLVRNRRDGYAAASRMDLIRGRVIGHPDGFGFVVSDEGGDDTFLSARQMHAVMHGDRVLVRVIGMDRRGRREGALVEVLEHAHHEIVGRFFKEGGVGFVESSNKRITHEIVIPAEKQGGAQVGQIVVAMILEQPTRRSQPVGQITEVLGDHMAPGMEMEIALRTHELPNLWSREAAAEAAAFGSDVPESAKGGGREDIRELPLVTIDGDDSRDFDDAVYCKKVSNGWKLMVAIADVSAYVKPDTVLDQEAWLRGNSVYFPENVIPMLPEILSNHLCSLNPDVDRLCMVCEMSITPGGKLRSYRFFEGVMRSHARLTYSKVAAMLVDNDADLCGEYEPLIPQLNELYNLYRAMRQARSKRGAIEFDRAETRIVFGEGRKIEQIVPTVRNDAHRLIEEFMICANVATAKFFEENDFPMVYRIHQNPAEEKLADLTLFLAEMGLKLGGGSEPSAKDYAKLLNEVQERDDRHLIETVLLRSMSQAVYSPENIGHFGLALEAYTHFTSPIRRYPDLLVHRGIRHLIGGGTAENFRYDHANMEEAGDHCSMTERRADDATRDAIDWLKCEYMMSRIGQEFSGIITSVTGFGLFVELDEIFVEGLVHITSLDNDYYHFDAKRHEMKGERSGMTYRLGDWINIRVARVDLDESKIDFALLGSPDDDGKEEKKKPSKKRSGKKRGSRNKGKKAEGVAGEQSGAPGDAPAKKKSRRRR